MEGVMMFKFNNKIQGNIFDETLQLSNYHQKLLNEGWAGYFKEKVFPKINEERFSVLYSNKASRPNTPVNIMVGLLILKEMNKQVDSELMQSLIFDTRYQYALWTTGYEKQPISRNAFTNFRNLLIKYELETGIDLYKEEMIHLANEINACCDKDITLKRMDSMMISSSCKRLSRLDLVYKVNSNLIEKISDVDSSLISEEEGKYLEKGFKKENVYDVTKENHEEKLKSLINDSKSLYNKFKDVEKINRLDEFKLLERLLNDQVNSENGDIKESKDIKPDSLQNPSDPDATFRYKYNDNVGYVANVVEEIHENGEIYITDYDVKQNTYSDEKFMEDYIEKKENDNKEVTIVDAAYYSDELDKKAAEKNIKLIPSQTMGKKQTNTELSNFEVDDKNHQVLRCPNGEAPTETKFNKEHNRYYAKFDKQKCEGCPLREKCEQLKLLKKNVASISFTEEKYHKNKLEAQMNSEDYKKISNNRAGVEGTMSVLRRKYNVDNCPSKGLLRLKLKFGGDIVSININKAIKYNKKSTNSAKISVLFINFLNQIKKCSQIAKNWNFISVHRFLIN